SSLLGQREARLLLLLLLRVHRNLTRSDNHHVRRRQRPEYDHPESDAAIYAKSVYFSCWSGRTVECHQRIAATLPAATSPRCRLHAIPGAILQCDSGRAGYGAAILQHWARVAARKCCANQR